MTKTVLAVGQESSGTRLLARVLNELGVQAVHRSVPHGRDMWSDPGPVDAAVAIVRSWNFVAASQHENRHDFIWMIKGLPMQGKLQTSFAAMVAGLEGLNVPWTVITYSSLVHDTDDVVAHLASFLSVAPVKIDDIRDMNARRHRAVR